MEYNKRVEQIKTYLERLSAGEELEKVRADFAKEFKAVDPAEIMQAEQELLQGGTPLETVQKLCDVHAALFRGATSEEKVANAEKAVAASVKEKKLAATAALTGITGHPLQTFTHENEVLENVIRECRNEIEETNTLSPELFGKLREVAIHYAKKGDLLYPHLKVKYGISGPSDVMWTTDDEIRDELAALAKQLPVQKTEDHWLERFRIVLQRVEDMIYKEANIFFPNCALNFTEEEWFGIYRDSKDYPVCFGVENATWEAAEKYLHTENCSKHVRNGEIIMPGGHLTVAQLTAMLNTIPLEITFVDEDNINRFFNEGPKDFKRPGMAIDREVFSSESGAAGASHYRGIPEGDARQSADLDGEKRKNHAGYLYGGAGCHRHISRDHGAGAGYGLCKRAFPFRRKSKRSSAARRYGRLTYFCFSI